VSHYLVGGSDNSNTLFSSCAVVVVVSGIRVIFCDCFDCLRLLYFQAAWRSSCLLGNLPLPRRELELDHEHERDEQYAEYDEGSQRDVPKKGAKREDDYASNLV
jgi:hypothetical protein